MPPTFSAMEFLTDSTRLFEVIPDLMNRASSPDRMRLLVKGAVQSGKSMILCAIVMYFTVVLDQSVVVLVRNMKPDALQFQDAWERFLGDFRRFCASRGVMLGEEEIPSLCLVNDRGVTPHRKEDGPVIMVALANAHQIKRIAHVVSESEADVALLVDEVDMLLYGDGDKVGEALESLLDNVGSIVGVTATAWEPLHAVEKQYFSTKDAYIMTPPAGYRGVLDQEYITIQDLPSKPNKMMNNTLLLDDDLQRFLIEHVRCDPLTVRRSDDREEKHPFLALINTERLVRRQDTLMQDIVSHPDLWNQYTIMTYHGNHITLYAPHLLPSADLRLPFCRNKKPTKDGNRLMYRNTSVRHVLQWIKDQPDWELRFPRILLIAQNMVGRGLNIVSYDYKWHLSHFFWRPSTTSRVESREQDQRGCGIFSDDLRCRVYCTEKDQRDLLKAHRVQEEIFHRWSSTPHQEMPLADAVKEMTFYKAKVPSGTIARHTKKFAGTIVHTSEDGGWSMEEFSGGVKIPLAPSARAASAVKTPVPLNDEQDVARLCRLFVKWGKGDSIIANFLQRLDPRKVYSHEDMKKLCRNNNVQSVTLSHMLEPHSSYRFGRILVGSKEAGYRLNPHLHQAYDENF